MADRTDRYRCASLETDNFAGGSIANASADDYIDMGLQARRMVTNNEGRSPGSIEGSIRAAQAGSGEAFTELFRATAPRVRAFARLRGVWDPDALTNDVLLATFRQIPSFEGDAGAWETFVFQIARNKIIDDHRFQKRRPERTAEDIGDRPDAPLLGGTSPSSEDDAMDRLGLGTAFAALDTLTTDQREVIVLRFVLDLSILQVSAVLDKPETSVKALQRRALATLRRNLEEGVSQ